MKKAKILEKTNDLVVMLNDLRYDLDCLKGTTNQELKKLNIQLQDQKTSNRMRYDNFKKFKGDFNDKWTSLTCEVNEPGEKKTVIKEKPQFEKLFAELGELIYNSYTQYSYDAKIDITTIELNNDQIHQLHLIITKLRSNYIKVTL